tara:strand:+ start:2543 stop:4219 length:1677 start_codon:yes stop_codon:yes gene_type:complete
MLEKKIDKNNMTLEKMGSRYPSRLSFSRSMLRVMVRDNWKLKRVKFELDNDGYGSVVYQLKTPNQMYSLVCFSQYLESKDRSDRVIADKWDTAYTLHIGKLSQKNLERLKKNVPLQEAGRGSPNELVLSRANKSVRLFNAVVESLSKGLQPNIKEINDVGYLLRTTAVYGNGKFGMSDYLRTKNVTDFDQPFRAEMLAVYIIREFSIDLVEHIAFCKNPSKAVKLENKIKQHLGIGNSTGLGMAPFIIKHPTLIHKWMSQYEKVLKKIKLKKTIRKNKFVLFIKSLKKAKLYLNEVITYDKYQKNKNYNSSKEIAKIIEYCEKISSKKKINITWKSLINYCEKNYCFDAQEIVKVQIIELFPTISDPFAEKMSDKENIAVKPSQKISSLLLEIKKKYKWAIKINFNDKNNNFLFWYTSEEKLEPRLGERYNEKGAELEQPLGVGKMVKELYNFIISNSKTHNLTVAEFLLKFPHFRGIIRRIQTLSKYKYGEVNDNILSKNTIPINMLRFKLSFFGASRYDPKSDRWLRVSFFAGAPFYNYLSNKNVDSWGFATMNSY